MNISIDIIKSLAEYDIASVHREWKKALRDFPFKVVVLDDDPTGIQTVHDIDVYTMWDFEDMVSAFNQQESMFFILTNSRGLDTEQTKAMHINIAQTLIDVSKATRKDFIIVSRSDSTLRGHYPQETEILRNVLESKAGMCIDGEIIMPFFAQGGRYTINNIHYVASGEYLVPSGETEFARDKTFGYKSSDLREWVDEKTKGEYPSEGVLWVSLEELRSRDLTAIEKKLSLLSGFEKLIVNAVSDADAEVFVTALISQLKKGKRFLFRSAAGFVRALGGIEPRGLLTHDELIDAENMNGGLIVVGSHVQKTSRQLSYLQNDTSLMFLELNQHLALDEAAFRAECGRAKSLLNDAIGSGISVVLHTRRERFDLNSGDKEAELRLAMSISHAITDIVASLTHRPSFIVAKGGITSSEIGTNALKVKRAIVPGQILPGVPVWRLGQESRFPGLSYVVFPGNVGEDCSLLDAVQKLRGAIS